MPISFEILQSSWWFRCIFILAVLYGLCSPFVMQWAQCRETRGQLQGGQRNIGWDKSKLWKPCLNMPYFILGYHSQTYIFKSRLSFSQADNSNFLTFLSLIILPLFCYWREFFFAIVTSIICYSLIYSFHLNSPLLSSILLESQHN